MAHIGTSTTFNFGKALDLRTADSVLAETWTQTAAALAQAGVMGGTCDTGFAFGSMIETPDGPVPVEQLMVGDLVLTADRDAVAITALGLSEHRATDLITIDTGAFDATRPVTLRAGHRFVVCSARAELLFGEAEVLVRAEDMVDHCAVARAGAEAMVPCVSLRLAQHDIVTVNGLACEAGALGEGDFAARPVLTSQEAMVLQAPLELAGYAGTAYALAAQ